MDRETDANVFSRNGKGIGSLSLSLRGSLYRPIVRRDSNFSNYQNTYSNRESLIFVIHSLIERSLDSSLIPHRGICSHRYADCLAKHGLPNTNINSPPTTVRSRSIVKSINSDYTDEYTRILGHNILPPIPERFWHEMLPSTLHHPLFSSMDTDPRPVLSSLLWPRSFRSPECQITKPRVSSGNDRLLSVSPRLPRHVDFLSSRYIPP